MTRSFLQPIKFDIRKRIAAPNGVNYDSLYRQNQNSNSLPLTAQMTVGELFMNIPTKLYTICIFCFCCYISSFSKAKILDLLSFCPKSAMVPNSSLTQQTTGFIQQSRSFGHSSTKGDSNWAST